MGEAYRTWIILYCTKALFACVALHVFSSIKMSKRKQETLGEFGFSKKVCHRDGEVIYIYIYLKDCIVKTLNFEKNH